MKGRLLFALVQNRWYLGTISAGPSRIGDGAGWTLRDPAFVDYLVLPAASPMGQPTMVAWVQVQFLGPEEMFLPAENVSAWAYDDLPEDGAQALSSAIAMYQNALRGRRRVIA